MRDSSVPARKPTPYSAMRPYLRTGDIVLCSGNALFSRIVRRVTGSEWSHCGMIIEHEITGELCIWESTTPTEVADIETGVPVSGVQLVPLQRRLQSYSGHVAVRRLEATRTREMLDALHDFRAEAAGKPFDKDIFELLRAAFDDDGVGLEDNVEDLAAYFCSELLAEAYQRMGLLPPNPPSNEYTPKDFSSEMPGRLRLPHRVRLCAEIRIDPE
jgi:hypothetical protein